MRLDELLGYAQGVLGSKLTTMIERKLAMGIIDMLGEAQPCGYELPEIVQDPTAPERIFINVDELLALPDARAYAAMIIRQAEKAETGT